MANYVNAADISDPSVSVTEAHCLAADVFVDSQLWQREIDPSDVVLPNSLLTSIATNWAKRKACTEGAIGEDSPLFKKAIEFEKDATRLAGTISRKALGIATSSSFGSITLGRG